MRLIWRVQVEIVVARSDDFGQTFEPVLVEDIERGLDKIALAARDGHVYVVYHSQQKIFASFSHDAGDSWEVAQPVHNTNSKLGVSLPSGAAIDSAGNAYFAWNGANRPGQAKGTVNLFVTRTTDGGGTWTTSIVDQSAAAASVDAVAGRTGARRWRSAWTAKTGLRGVECKRGRSCTEPDVLRGFDRWGSTGATR